jgi:hypothetical protein
VVQLRWVCSSVSILWQCFHLPLRGGLTHQMLCIFCQHSVFKNCCFAYTPWSTEQQWEAVDERDIQHG